ncbi:MFS transporter [Pseudarthrobacter sp. SL88]|uniref:MFS transporter n=1 Tax=Pseudarthrobacter sp. SL88 TaxID=2994666 RepID=UPI00227460BE|nr:MFS transporter [Pseudarthrobacter sp. SL88]MCY1674934.1 MFS transporter [Pseudarthrobacter sp. SL88]
MLTRADFQDDLGQAPVDSLPYEDLGTYGDSEAAAPESDPAAPAELFPWAALLVMALMGFVLIATETMPAGLLPQIAAELDVTEGTAGQFVSAYALGTVVAAMPAIALTRGMRRKPVFIVGILGFLAANLTAAASTDIVLSLVARLLAGAFSGLLWGMLAGYARRITAPKHAGRALSVASIGTPVGLAVGTPFGAWIGTTFDWRWSFGVLSILTVLTLLLAALLVPDAPGQRAATRVPLGRVLAIPGVAVILGVIVSWMLGHNIMYTYIGSYLRAASVDIPVEAALLTFGAAAIAGIALTAAVIDKCVRRMVLLSLGTFTVAGVIFIVGQASAVAVFAAIILWGIAFGGAAAQLQTAISAASGENADVANSMLGVAFNLAIFAAGLAGAMVISSFDGLVLPVALVGLAAVALLSALAGRRTAFPA